MMKEILRDWVKAKANYRQNSREDEEMVFRNKLLKKLQSQLNVVKMWDIFCAAFTENTQNVFQCIPK